MIQVADKKKILLVDDDSSLTSVLSMLFETRGYDVTVAHSGREALEKVHSAIDLILLDLILPDIGGFNVCRQLRENEKTQDISIIMLTAKGLTTDVVEGLHLGADDYLTKPVEYEELLARMEAVMRRGAFLNAGGKGLEKENDTIIELRRIIDRGLIKPFFQPIFLLDPFRLYGFEALSRPDTTTSLSAPDLLFKAALQYGFYQDIEILAWKKALEYASTRLNGNKLFLNCNPYLVEGAKFMAVMSLFEENDINVENVFLEITERSAIANADTFYEHLQVYRDCGFKFAVDDVGGGYASLESIVETRPEVVKIDQHIISQIAGDTFRRSIVKFIVSFCQEHKIISVAEGIETKEDYQTAKDLGVTAGQGFYFYRPSSRIDPSDVIMNSIDLTK